MSKYIGRLVDLGIAKEGTRGLGGAPTYWVPKATVTIDPKITKAKSALSYGNIGADGNQALKALVWSEGDIETDMQDNSFGLFLLSLLGTVSTAGPADSLYTHTFTLQNDAQHDSLAITVKDPNEQRQYRLSMLQSLSITATPEDTVKITASFMGKKGTDTTHSVTYTAHNKFLGRHVSLKLATDTSGLAAATALNIRSLTLNFEKNLRTDSVLGTVEPIDFLNQAFSINGEVEMDLEDDTYLDLQMDGSYRAVRVDITNNEAVIGVSAHPQFTLDLSRVHFEAWESNRPNDEISTQKFSFNALLDITNNNFINSCTLKNDVASY